MMPPLPVASPEYPFQMVCGDYFDVKGKSWLVLVDRFTGWLSLFYYPREASSTDLVKDMKHYFSTFGISEQFSSDSGPQFRSSQFQEFLRCWGVEHRVSSAYHPKSNLRAETAVKSAKRIVMENTKLDGSPMQDKIQRAIMQHRNTPDTEFGLSPSQLLFGRPIRDFLPIRPGQFSPHEVWVDCREKREVAFRTRLMRGVERWSEHSRDLPPLEPGTKVLIQNQYGAGKTAKKWDKSGLVIESLGFNKYRVRIDGSGRITDRNRQFLKKFTPVTPTSPGPSPNCLHSSSRPSPRIDNEMPVASDPTPRYQQVVPDQGEVPVPSSPPPAIPQSFPNSPGSPSFVTPPSSPVVNIPERETITLPPVTPTMPRRSTRVRQPPERFKYDQNFEPVA